MSARVRMIVDNTAAEGLAAEHGLSMLIEAGGKKILFDAGQGDALERNAAALGIDISRVDYFVLSHGHYDHTGAVDFVLAENPELTVFAHPDIFKTRYSLHPDQPPKEVSMPSEERLIIANMPDSHLNWVREPTEIAPGVWLTGPIPRNHPLEDTGGPFFDDPEGETPDLIADDQSMWIETPRGLLVVCGCCHSGLINTLDHIAAATNGARVWGVIGGLHLKHAGGDRLAATVEKIRTVAPDFVAPCHCTGESAVDYFKRQLKTEIRPAFAGTELITE